MSQKSKLVLSVVFVVVCWATAFASIRVALQSYSPSQLAFLRFLEASIIMAMIAPFKKIRLFKKIDILYFFLAGFAGVAVYHLALNAGEQSVNAGTASFLINTSPIFTAIISTFVLKEKIAPLGWIGIIVSFLGVSFISFAKEGGLEIQPGALLILVSALSVGVYAAIQKIYLSQYNSFEVATFSIWTGMIILIPFSGGSFQALSQASTASTLCLVWLGSVPGAIAYILWAYALSKLPANKVVSFLYFMPILATFIGWIWLGEVLNRNAIVGGIIVLAGIYLLHTSKKLIRSAS